MEDDKTAEPLKDVRRRDALKKLGLGALAVYSAPTVLHIDRSANAIVVPTPCHYPGRGRAGPNRCPPGHRGDDDTRHRGHLRDRDRDRDRQRDSRRRDD